MMPATYKIADPVETRRQMIAAGKRNLARYKRRFAGYVAAGCPQLVEIERGSMNYLDAKRLAGGQFGVCGEAA